MVFEKATIQLEKITTEYIKGQRAAERGRKYFNPYSKVTQPVQYRQFEYGWDNKQAELHPIDLEKKTILPQLAVLILGLILAGAFSWWKYM